MKNSHQPLVTSCELGFVICSILVLIVSLTQAHSDLQKFNGITTGVHQSTKLHTGAESDVHLNAFSSSSVTTATTHSKPQVQVVSYKVPAEAFLTGAPPGVAATLVSSSESIIGATSSRVVTRPTLPFVRPIGPLPISTEHFGIENPRPLGPHSVPNCGCVTRGACLGEVGAYTRLVLAFTDVVCGHTFQTCCFDGAWAGSYDSFAIAAPCVAKEECSRPYGVLPTDIRDFGVIAPCPGLGAVRCITVDSVGLLEFQAAVAAIDASNAYHAQYIHSNPVHFVIPIELPGGGIGEATTVETTATSSISSLSSLEHADDVEDNLCCEPGKPIAGTPIVIGQLPIPVQPQTIFQPAVPIQPNIIVQPAAPSQPNIIIQAADPVQPNIIFYSAPPAQSTIVFNVPAPITPPILVEGETLVPPVVVPPPVAVATPIPVPVTPVVRPHIIPTPIAGPLSPFFGYGGGLGFRKRISFTKGFGFGAFGK